MYRFLVDVLKPYSVTWLILSLAVVVLWRKTRPPRKRVWLVTTAFLFLTLISIPAVAFLTLASLEWHYPPAQENRPADAQTIVVLSGSIRASEDGSRTPEPGGDSIYRCLLAYRIYQSGPPCPIIVTGGKVEPDDPGPDLAKVMRDYLVQLGAAPEDVIVENESRTTYENAFQVARILRRRGWDHIVLVTDAMHMLRSDLCFRKQGIRVTARGASYNTAEFPWSFGTFWPNSYAIVGVERAAHEWLGILWYRIKGRI